MTEDKFFEIKKQILIEIKKWDKIIIHRHERPDADALGAQGGLAELIRTSFPEIEVFTAGVDNRTRKYFTTMNPPEKSDYDQAVANAVDTASPPRTDGKEAL